MNSTYIKMIINQNHKSIIYEAAYGEDPVDRYFVKLKVQLRYLKSKNTDPVI